MTADEIRELLVGARKALDDAAKQIVEDARGGRFNQLDIDEARELAADTARGKILTVFDEEVLLSANRCSDAFENWEVREAVPLNEDQTFMDALRRLLRDAKEFPSTGGD